MSSVARNRAATFARHLVPNNSAGLLPSKGDKLELAAHSTLWNKGFDQINGKPSELRGKTIFITGASRGIGLEIAKRCAREGANVCIAAKTVIPHPTLPGTIYTAAAECEKLGGRALAVRVNVLDEKTIEEAMEKCVATFGGIDVLISNASAIHPQPIETMSAKRFDLMVGVNVRGTLLVAKHAIPHLKKSRNPHILIMSPPLNPEVLSTLNGSVNYMATKWGMTIAAVGLSSELKYDGIASNSLWPTGLITTSALNHLMGNDPETIDSLMMQGRLPKIIVDCTIAIICSGSKTFTGNQLVDEDFLRRMGKLSFEEYEYRNSGSTPEERLKTILAKPAR